MGTILQPNDSYSDWPWTAKDKNGRNGKRVDPWLSNPWMNAAKDYRPKKK